jgi:ligand-binding sensor domain-containing protein/signal transduction histidine kinase
MPALSTTRQTALLRSALLLCVSLCLGENAPAERLPIKTYTTNDGLARDTVVRIKQDSRGFLWFCTLNGLSRFDGYRFVNYNVEQGLPDPRIYDLLETKSGEYWIATQGGIARFSPDSLAMSRREETWDRHPISGTENKGGLLFTEYLVSDNPDTNNVNVLFQDAAGIIWVGTAGGLFRLEETMNGVRFVNADLGLRSSSPDEAFVTSITQDRIGTLWVGMGNTGLYRLWPDGHSDHYTSKNGLPNNFVRALLLDRQERIWVGLTGGLCLLVPDPGVGHSIVERLFTTGDGLPENNVWEIKQPSDNRYWVSTLTGGLSVFDGERFHNYTKAQGLASNSPRGILEDRDGNLWIGTDSNGAMKLAKHGFVAYGNGDGIVEDKIWSIFHDTGGGLCTITGRQDVGVGFNVNQLIGNRFTSTRLNMPRYVSNSGWGLNQITFQDHTGDWWVATAQGLFRFSNLKSTGDLAIVQPTASYTVKDGLPADDIFRLFEDLHGDIWISTIYPEKSGMARWERATGKIHAFSDLDGVPPDAPTLFSEDRQGDLWIGFYKGGIARYRNGRFQFFAVADGLGPGSISGIYPDDSGRIWIATAVSGLYRVNNPQSDHPAFVHYSKTDGISSSNRIYCVTGDKWGRIYVGTDHGLDRLDSNTNNVDHFTVADGLPSNAVELAFRDGQDKIWFGTGNGLCSFVPEEARTRLPTVYIGGVRIGGEQFTISELGETRVVIPEIGPAPDDLQIEFFAIEFATGKSILFQYKLEGVNQDWSAPTGQRSINYAKLAPGNYRFQVRVVGSDSVDVSTVTFAILPPIWRRWWFLTLTMMLLAGVAYLLYRYRVAQLIHVERVRTRIASDLHDDIGSSLSQIAVLSEVLRTQANQKEIEFARPLAQIARVSREAVDSMSDIVWAINPQRDHLHDLTRRMRRFASESFPASGIEFSLRVPGPEQDIRLGADIRRQVFMIFKEGVNNIVRHSACSAANIEFKISGHWLILCLKDDGKGFDPNGVNEGNGLASLRRRAKSMGGELEISSENGNGATLTLKIPLSHRS